MSTTQEKIAPVQGYSQGIPWWLHMKAYDVYCRRFGPQPALIEGWCRGGFGVEELDMFVPGWRDEISEMAKVKAELQACHAVMEDLAEALGQARQVIHHNFDEPEVPNTWKHMNEALASFAKFKSPKP